MIQTRSSEVLSLDTTKQKQVVKETKQLKKKIKDGTVTIKEARKVQKLTDEQRRGLLFISHLPHGFYEEELKKYFQQFGKVTNVKVCRSGRTGNSKGYGYVEFSNPEVAKIAAETMNNYLMFKKRITANFVPNEKRPKGLFMGKSNTATKFSAKVRREKQYRANLKVNATTHLKRTATRLSKVNKKLAKLQKMNIKTTYTPVDVTTIKQAGSSSEGITPTNVTDPFDSDIELKVLFNKSKKTINNIKSVSDKGSSKTINSSKSSRSNKRSSLEADPAPISDKVKTAALANVKKIKKNKQSKGITKKAKKLEPLNNETVKKIARELIRKRGNSLLTRPVEMSRKRKSPKK